jgi:hypothetical protein
LRRGDRSRGCPILLRFGQKGGLGLAASVRPEVIGGYGLRRADFEFGLLRFVQPDWPGRVKGIVAEAAPRPLLGREHQATLHGIAMHVAEFFHALAFGENVEIVEAFLPDVSIGEGIFPKPGLRRIDAGAVFFRRRVASGLA